MTQLKNRLPLFMAAMLVVGVTLVIVAPVAAKHAKQEKETKQPATITNAAGKVVKVTAGDETHYALQDAAGKNLFYLEVGPKWYYAAGAYPLDKYAGQVVPRPTRTTSATKATGIVTVTARVKLPHRARTKIKAPSLLRRNNGSEIRLQAAPRKALLFVINPRSDWMGRIERVYQPSVPRFQRVVLRWRRLQPAQHLYSLHLAL